MADAHEKESNNSDYCREKHDNISLEVVIRFELCVHVCCKWVSGAELS